MSGRTFRASSARVSLLAGVLAGLAVGRGGVPAETGEPALDAEDRSHWAFRPLASAEPPRVRDAAWVRNPIDRFVLSRLEAAGLAPMPEAPRETLIRRLSFDLTGLPPKPRELDAFLADGSPYAYEKLADRLLASTAYAERWAQHWLDLARFAETDGFEHDAVRPNAWRYRNWVIEAFDRDLPYDEFAGLQIAGDEMRPGDPWALVATGFALAGPDMPDINLDEERRHMVLNEMAGTVGSVFLGLQVGCAQCHDHKFDPISQVDFYRTRAVFEPGLVFGERPLGPDDDVRGRVLHEAGPWSEPSYLRIRGDFRRRGTEVEPGFPRVANPWAERIEPAGAKAVTSGRRLAFAEWLTRPDHFLTTRVIANRIWQHHFGRGLVATPSDFGRMGEEPTHPELLDWLAGELVRQGWSLKRFHRLIVTSAAYRQSASPRRATGDLAPARRTADESSAIDPENRLYSRAAVRRLEGEAIRDAMLAAAGRLSRARTSGPGIMAPLPEEVLRTVRKDHWKVGEDEEAHRRRSVYLFVRRNLRYPFLEAFDRPDPNMSCARRDRSTTAPQALVLLNSEFALDCARRLAARVWDEAGSSPAGRVEHAFRLALGRSPEEGERDEALAFLKAQAERIRREGRPESELATPVPVPRSAGAAEGAALVHLSLALFNLNEFVHVE